MAKKEEISYEELIDLCTRIAFDALITSGGKGLRGSMYQINQHMFAWHKKREEKEVHNGRKNKTLQV